MLEKSLSVKFRFCVLRFLGTHETPFLPSHSIIPDVSQFLWGFNKVGTRSKRWYASRAASRQGSLGGWAHTVTTPKKIWIPKMMGLGKCIYLLFKYGPCLVFMTNFWGVMEEILRTSWGWSFIPMIYQVFYFYLHPKWLAGFLPSTISWNIQEYPKHSPELETPSHL